MKQHTIACLLVLVLGLAVPGSASDEKGRLNAKVVDMDGKPLRGVSVVISCDGSPGYREVKTTNRHGVFQIEILKLHLDYHLRFKTAGYFPYTFQFRSTQWVESNIIFTMPWEPVDRSSAEAIAAMEAGITAYQAEEPAAAEAKLLEATQLNPGLHQAWALLSLVMAGQERYESTVDAADRAIDLGNRGLMARQTRVQAYRHIGTTQEFSEAYEELREAGRLLKKKIG